MASGPVKREASSAKPADTEDNVRKAVLASLERRRRTRSELETMLRRKGFTPAMFTPVLDRLTEVGLIDDMEYARIFLRRRAASRPRGARLLRGELLGKGIPDEIADQALAEMKLEGDPVEDALRALKPWLPKNSGLPPRDRSRKLWQYLARRGFSGDVIERAHARAFSGVTPEEADES